MTDPRTLLQVFDAAIRLLEPPGAWTQRALARDAEGRVVGHLNDEAVCYCGALQRAAAQTITFTESYTYNIADAARVFLDSTLNAGVQAAVWNDSPARTQEDVLRALRFTRARLVSLAP